MRLLTKSAIFALTLKQIASTQTYHSPSIGIDVEITDEAQLSGHEILGVLGPTLMGITSEEYHGARAKRVMQSCRWKIDATHPESDTIYGLYSYEQEPGASNRHTVTIFGQSKNPPLHLKYAIRHESMHAEQNKQNEDFTYAMLCSACEATYPSSSSTNVCAALDNVAGYATYRGQATNHNHTPSFLQSATASWPNVMATPYFPVTEKERNKFIGLMQLGIDRVSTALERSKQGIITNEEIDLLRGITRGYIPETSFCPILLDSYPELQNKAQVLSQLRSGKPITIGLEVNKPGSIFSNKYEAEGSPVVIPAQIYKIEYLNDKIAMATFKHSEDSLSAFLFDILNCDNKAGINQRKNPDEHVLEVHAHLIENLNIRQLQYFFPEMLAYEKQKTEDANQAHSIAERCFSF